MKPPLIIYHGGCPDGFTAAWVCHVAYDGNVELYAATYGEPPPDVAGRDVVIVDFSYPRETLIEMHEVALSLRVYDHHKTAQADLEGLEFCVFDMERSGAGIAWDELMAPRKRPWLVDYVEDRDLWRFNLPHSREVSDYVMALEHDLAMWDALRTKDLKIVKEYGSIIRQKIDSYCRAMIKMVRYSGPEGLRTIPVVNAPYPMISDVLNAVLEEHADAPYAVGWFQRGDGRYQYSLRSRGVTDVSAIAKVFGGGGHHNAAGFVSDERVPEYT